MKALHLSFDKRFVLSSVLVLALAGCGLFKTDSDYKKLERGASLEVPPDLSRLQRDDRYAVPEGASRTATASQMAAGAAGNATGGAPLLPTVKVARIEREGNQRWLVVNMPPEQVFPIARDFWTEGGFTLTTEDKEAGVLETDWSRGAAMPRTGLRAFLGKLGDTLFDTGDRDRYRTRLERVGDHTEVYISHRGATEVLTSTKDMTVWQPRPNDPNLEAEYLQKLLVRLGGDELKPKDAAADAAGKDAPVVLPARARLIAGVGSAGYVELDDNFDRAWRRVGLALDRSGFTVEERDRANGRYAVRYVDPDQDKESPGFFARMFGAKEIKPQQYRVSVKTQGAVTRVSVEPGPETVVGKDKQADASPRILTLLHDELK